MNLNRKFDLAGADFRARQDFRNYLMMRYPYEEEGGVLFRLEAGEEVSARRVQAALESLLATNWSIDLVYKFGPEDTQRFLRYVERQVLIEKMDVQLRKALELMVAADMDTAEFDRHVFKILDEVRP